jgi:hypothetical protein
MKQGKAVGGELLFCHMFDHIMEGGEAYQFHEGAHMRKLDDLTNTQAGISSDLGAVHTNLAELDSRFSAQHITISLAADIDQHKADVKEKVQAIAARAPEPLARAGFASTLTGTVDAQFLKLKRSKSHTDLSQDTQQNEEFSPPGNRIHGELASTKPTTAVTVLLPSLQNEPSQKRAIATQRQWKSGNVADKVLLETSQLSMHIFFGEVFIATEIWRLRKFRSGDAVADDTEMKTEFRFHPAPWLVQCGFVYGFRLVQQQNRPKYSLEPFRAVQDDAMVFEIAYSGNLSALKVLFDRGHASILDTDSRGWTPLAWAAYGMHTPTVQFLLDCKSDPDAKVRSHRDKEQYNE